MKIALGSDKSGFELKEFIKGYLKENRIELEDLGTQSMDAGQPFFEVAPKVAAEIQSGRAERGILICGTGMGMSQVANKYEGVLAACCESVYAARMCRAINNSNVLCMGGWIIAKEMGLEMVKAFLSTEHTEGLEEWRRDFLKKGFAKVRKIDAGQHGGEGNPDEISR
ncbi:MAG TPA: RpiB/LacA/LacB family sugar-phosphate isomerase [Ruminococcaceae bacterium]|jgi:ribose 5-phosphate isomerase B|nr:RpiB/LacA/LacB family sugar-phosphate isomerase [Oscillospiraceae bacterium]